MLGRERRREQGARIAGWLARQLDGRLQRRQRTNQRHQLVRESEGLTDRGKRPALPALSMSSVSDARDARLHHELLRCGFPAVLDRATTSGDTHARR